MSIEKHLDEAIEEAERFLKRAKELKEVSDGRIRGWYPSQLNSAVRRSSMDLTRTLANLRRYRD